MTAHPISETIASLMPRAKAELTELVAFQSVADPAQFPKSECEAAAAWVADALRTEDFQDVALLDTLTAPSRSTASCPARPAPRPYCSTRTTTCSRRSTSRPGSPRRSS